ncbi:MAG: 50S ribosomal protein L3 [Patescibacteria group bacterium]
MAFILGKKIGMTRIFQEDGTVVPVTLVEAGPVMVTQIKTKDKDGYDAVQIGYGIEKKPNKSKTGHLKDLKSFKILIETKIITDKKRGDEINTSSFSVGDSIKVSGLSKAKGFQGAVKRHGFHGMPASHGHHHVLRHVGSIGQRFPQHTLKGMRMAGRMGGTRISTRGLRIVSIDNDNNLLAIKGAVPGRRGTLLEISKL